MKTKKQKWKLRELKEKAHETQRVNNLDKTTNSSIKHELREIKRSNRIPKGAKHITNTHGYIIELNNVNKTYVTGSVKYEALKNVDVKIKKGDFTVILGQSGSGKTSLLNVISGLDRATTGDIIVENLNISALTDRELTTFRRNKVGFIFQSYNLLLELNAKDNAEMGRRLQIDNNKRMDLDELFKRVDLEGREKDNITQLSGGGLQRVSIVRALAKNPLIICADEPTGALDSVTSKKIIELFKEINKKYGTTIILVTHDESIVKHATRLITVKDGVVNVEAK